LEEDQKKSRGVAGTAMTKGVLYEKIKSTNYCSGKIQAVRNEFLISNEKKTVIG